MKHDLPLVLLLSCFFAASMAVSFASLGAQTGDSYHWTTVESRLNSEVDFQKTKEFNQLPTRDQEARTRNLALLYRENDKLEKAAAIMRDLWKKDLAKPVLDIWDFRYDSGILGDLLLEQSDIPGAVDCFSSALTQDTARIPTRFDLLAGDQNNLGIVYYWSAIGNSNAAARKVDLKNADRFCSAAKEQLGKHNYYPYFTSAFVDLDLALIHRDLDEQDKDKSERQEFSKFLAKARVHNR